MVSGHGLNGLEIERSGFRLRIDGRSVSPAAAEGAELAPAPARAPAGAARQVREASPAPAEASLGEAASGGEGGAAADAHILNSPIVGTFYAASSPDRRPFVAVGDRVTQGTGALHHRGDEADERDRVRRRRRGRRDLPEERPAGRVRRAAVRDPSSLTVERVARHVQEDPDRQPRRDRAARHPGLPRAGHPDGRGVLAPPTATACTSPTPTRTSASDRRRRATSYLNISAIISAAEITGADAIHPGYGFLAENAHFAEVLAGVPARLDRPAARGHPADGRQGARRAQTAHAAGVPVLPGSQRAARRRRRGASAWRPRSATRSSSRRRPAAAGAACASSHAEDEIEGQFATAREEADEGLRRRLDLPREVPGRAAPHRVPGLRRPARQRRSTWASASARSSAATRS